MSNIKTWSTTAASNNSAAPDGWPEGMAPSDVNNAAREMMAALRTQHEDASWIDLGDTPTYASATTFTIAGDVTTAYAAYRRIRATDSSTLYGSIVSSNYSAPNTTVTVVLDSGSLSGSLSAVALGIIEPNAAPTLSGTVQLVVKGSDESVTSSTTLQDDDDLTLTLDANSTYYLECFVFVNGDPSGDYKFQFSLADGTFLIMENNGSTGTCFQIDESLSARVVGTSGTSTAKILTYDGRIVTSTLGGIFKLQWAQNISNATATTVEANSWIKATKLA